MLEVGGVREYNRIRRFLSCIYLYGFFSREDFARAGIGSVKDYDFGMKLIRSIFPDVEEAARWEEGRKYPRFARSYARSGENRMADSYLLHSLDTGADLPELLKLLSALGEGARTLEELRRRLETCCQEEETDQYARIRRRVLELAEYGYVEKRGRRFSLSPDSLRQLTQEELEQVYELVAFAAGTIYPRVTGSFLRRSLEREMLRRGLQPPAEAALLLRHSVNANVFDEEIVCQLQELLTVHAAAVLTTEEGRVSALPAALRIDTRLGRWYLLSLEEGVPVIRRVRRIRSVKRGAPVDSGQWEAAQQAVQKRFAKAGCSGALPWGKPVRVEARLEFAGAPGLRSQFARELRLGRIVAREDGEYYEAEVNDPLELLPLLRAYSPWLRVVPGPHGLDRRLREDLLQMRRAAEGVGHESFQ